MALAVMVESFKDSKFAAATFRVFSKTHRADYFASLLGISADTAGVMGELKNSLGKSSAVFKSNTYLVHSGIASSEPLERHIEALLDRIESASGLFDQAKQHADLDMLFGYGSENGQGGAHLTSQLLRRLSALGIDIVFDLYPPENFTNES